MDNDPLTPAERAALTRRFGIIDDPASGFYCGPALAGDDQPPLTEPPPPVHFRLRGLPPPRPSGITRLHK